MSQALIEKIRKARETVVEADGRSFTVRRPTDLEYLQLRSTGATQGEIMHRFVVDWHGITELDLIPGGTGAPVPFDADLFLEWAADQPQLWSPLSDAIMQSYSAHLEKLGDALGKPNAG